VICGTLVAPASCAAHGDRIADRACVVCGRAVCGACRRGDRHTALCPEHGDVRILGGWAELARTSDEVDAELLAARLTAAGVEARVLSQKDRANVVTFGGLSVVRVLVPAHRLLEAREGLDSGRVDERSRPEGA
jgi:hypothetical protein